MIDYAIKNVLYLENGVTIGEGDIISVKLVNEENYFDAVVVGLNRSAIVIREVNNLGNIGNESVILYHEIFNIVQVVK